jgi:hypothetical protein
MKPLHQQPMHGDRGLLGLSAAGLVELRKPGLAITPSCFANHQSNMGACDGGVPHAMGGVDVGMFKDLPWAMLAVAADVLTPGHDAAPLAVPPVGLPHPAVVPGSLSSLAAGLGARMLFEQLRHGGLGFDLAEVKTDLFETGPLLLRRGEDFPLLDVVVCGRAWLASQSASSLPSHHST